MHFPASRSCFRLFRWAAAVIGIRPPLLGSLSLGGTVSRIVIPHQGVAPGADGVPRWATIGRIPHRCAISTAARLVAGCGKRVGRWRRGERQSPPPAGPPPGGAAARKEHRATAASRHLHHSRPRRAWDRGGGGGAAGVEPERTCRPACPAFPQSYPQWPAATAATTSAPPSRRRRPGPRAGTPRGS